jgi:NTE family protein
VLDRLLEEEALEIGWISATSAGAVNAVALAAGLAEGGSTGARANLRAVWEAVSKAGVPDLLRLNPLLAGISRSQALQQVATLFSPYDFNPLGFDPFRKLLETHIDFAQLRSTPGPELLIAASEVATGRPRLFRRREITVESVLASACLPTLHHAVVIDGVAYWDGGFSANPELLALARESPVTDTLLVKISSRERGEVPTTAREIAARINHLTFSQPLLREVEVIETVRRLYSRWSPRASGADARVARHRFHLIDAGRFTGALAPDSKAKPDAELLSYLCNSGRGEAQKWLARHRRSIGVRSSVDLRQHFLASNAPVSSPRTRRRDPPGAAV